MKIKEVEKRVGITRANIRYYEKEGLFSPVRNGENYYREYSEEDISRLEQIKVLRILGVSVADIRLLGEGKVMLEEIMERRLEEINEEERGLREIRKVCRSIQHRGMDYSEIDGRVFEPGTDVWRERLEKLLKEDIVKEILTPAQLNRNLAVLLSSGYLVNALIALLFGSWLLGYQNGGIIQVTGIGWRGTGRNEELRTEWLFLMAIVSAITVLCYMGIYFTKNMKIHGFLFAMTACCLTPVVSCVLYITGDLKEMVKATFAAEVSESYGASYFLPEINGTYLTVFWALLAVYVFMLYLVSKKWEFFFSKARYVLLTALTYSCVVTVFMGMVCDKWLMTAVLSGIFTFYIGLSWFHTYMDRTKYNRYYAIVSGSRIMNIGGVVFQMFGKTSISPTVYR